MTEDFLRVGGKSIEGIVAPAGPVTVAEQLPDSHPIKKVAVDFTKLYETTFGQEADCRVGILLRRLPFGRSSRCHGSKSSKTGNARVPASGAGRSRSDNGIGWYSCRLQHVAHGP